MVSSLAVWLQSLFFNLRKSLPLTSVDTAYLRTGWPTRERLRLACLSFRKLRLISESGNTYYLKDTSYFCFTSVPRLAFYFQKTKAMTYSLPCLVQNRGLTHRGAQQREVAEWLLSESIELTHIPQTHPLSVGQLQVHIPGRWPRPAPLAAFGLLEALFLPLCCWISLLLPPHTFETSETVNGNQISLIILWREIPSLRGPGDSERAWTVRVARGLHPAAFT